MYQRLPFLTLKLSENRIKSIKIMVSPLLPSYYLAHSGVSQNLSDSKGCQNLSDSEESVLLEDTD